MSLIRQLWLAIGALMALAFGVSFVVSTLSAKHYLEEQLYLKNLDNAGSLALSISHMSRDPVTVELQLAAQFDTGHYQVIRLVGPSGEVMVERQAEADVEGAPGWFMRLIPIEAEAGVASVMDGWKLYGTLTVESQTRYAYAALWSGTLQLLGWFLAAAMLSGVLGSLMLKRITRPLGDVVAQAEAIGGRRFVTTHEPRTLEFRTVVRAMNSLAARVKGMLAEESRRLEVLRHEIQHDPLTGLLAREPFLSQLESLMQREDASASGGMLIVRVAPLAQLNTVLGREGTDQLLKDVAKVMSLTLVEHPDAVIGRLNGADFAVIAPQESHPAGLAQLVQTSLASMAAEQPIASMIHFPVGGTSYAPGETITDVLARVDGALAQAEQLEADEPVLAESHGVGPHVISLAAWRESLGHVFEQSAVKLASYPVVDAAGSVLHLESPVRILIEDQWHGAGIIMPWVARLGWQGRLDAEVVRCAIETLQTSHDDLCINVSAESIAEPAFRAALIEQLQQVPTLACRLWIDVPEAGALRHLDAFRSLCIALQPLGCKIGLEHVGKHFARIGELHDIGLDYLKVDVSLIRDIHLNTGNQAFLRGLCMVAHAIGLQAIAEGVMHANEINMLFTLGMDGVTGPGVRQQGA